MTVIGQITVELAFIIGAINSDILGFIHALLFQGCQLTKMIVTLSFLSL